MFWSPEYPACYQAPFCPGLQLVPRCSAGTSLRRDQESSSGGGPEPALGDGGLQRWLVTSIEVALSAAGPSVLQVFWKKRMLLL